MKPVRRPARQWLLMIHVVCSVGWLGAGAANLVLSVTAVATDQVILRHACYLLIERLDYALVIPLAFSSLITGVVISVATKWGLLRHWWVLVKLVLTIVVILFSTFGVGVFVERNIAATTANPLVPSPLGPALVVGAVLNLVAFLFMTRISISKPWPRTPWAGAPDSQGKLRQKRNSAAVAKEL